jgi:hypothetical protein
VTPRVTIGTGTKATQVPSFRSGAILGITDSSPQEIETVNMPLESAPQHTTHDELVELDPATDVVPPPDTTILTFIQGILGMIGTWSLWLLIYESRRSIGGYQPSSS